MKALIVDDDQTIRLFLRRILEGRLQCQVTEAENGKKALEVLQKLRPDFMLMDICMPDISGDELLEMLRKTPAYKNLPVIVLSAISDKEMIAKLLSLGISDYMLKPMEVRSTFDRIKLFMKKIDTEKTSAGGLNSNPQVENTAEMPG
ncbi:MAG: response regulator [Ignavibacteriales bacterium]|nr:MAG: response regulator [Ignavibacteriales bacterium]